MSRRWLLVLLLVAVGWAPVEASSWGWLGVRIRDISEREMEEISLRHGIGEGFGALVVEVLPETPAARDGLKNGDLVVAFRGRPVVDTRSLQRLVAATPVGEEVTLTILRETEGRRALTVRVGLMPREVAAERVAGEFGFLIRDRPEERSAAALGLSIPTVGFVLEGSPADRAGVKSGDVIMEVNGKVVLSRAAASEALAETPLEQPLRLTLRRGEEQIRLTVAAPSRPEP